MQQYMATVGEQARGASRAMARATAGDKNAALSAIAGALRAHRSAILDANQRDLAR
ncbi:MAG TPA: gamma-glutamyl-phosphate reductase, partial [Alcanivorax sp.]|nr:gamma-glutamyl-phosphate reductase [Alcanivorax sp.]